VRGVGGAGGVGGVGGVGGRRASQYNRPRKLSLHALELSKWRERRGEPTHFRWDASVRVKRRKNSDVYHKRMSTESVRLRHLQYQYELTFVVIYRMYQLLLTCD